MSSNKRYVATEQSPWEVHDRHLAGTCVSDYLTRTAAREAAVKLNMAWRDKVEQYRKPQLDAAK